MEPNFQSDRLPYEIENSLLDNRIITLTEEISPSSAKTVIGKILYLESKSDDPIQIYVSSPGGSVSDCLSIIDAMELSKCDVNTIAIGDCCSAAAIILSCGKHRKIFPHAHVMYHQLSSVSFGKMNDIQINYDLCKELQNTLEDILIQHTKITSAMLKKWSADDVWLTATKAVKYGIVDEIMKR